MLLKNSVLLISSYSHSNPLCLWFVFLIGVVNSQQSTIQPKYFKTSFDILKFIFRLDQKLFNSPNCALILSLKSYALPLHSLNLFIPDWILNCFFTLSWLKVKIFLASFLIFTDSIILKHFWKRLIKINLSKFSKVLNKIFHKLENNLNSQFPYLVLLHSICYSQILLC